MLFLLFQLGKDRYALEASRVVEVVPLLELKQLPQAPGAWPVFSITAAARCPRLICARSPWATRPASALSTRIIIVNYPDDRGTNHLLGLIAEHATEMLRKERQGFRGSRREARRGAVPGPGPHGRPRPHPMDLRAAPAARARAQLLF